MRKWLLLSAALILGLIGFAAYDFFKPHIHEYGLFHLSCAWDTKKTYRPRDGDTCFTAYARQIAPLILAVEKFKLERQGYPIQTNPRDEEILVGYFIEFTSENYRWYGMGGIYKERFGIRWNYRQREDGYDIIGHIGEETQLVYRRGPQGGRWVFIPDAAAVPAQEIQLKLEP